MKIWNHIKPDWYNLDEETLKKYRTIGIFLFVFGIFWLIQSLPTIKLFSKIMAAACAGVGFQYFRTTTKLLNK